MGGWIGGGIYFDFGKTTGVADAKRRRRQGRADPECRTVYRQRNWRWCSAGTGMPQLAWF